MLATTASVSTAAEPSTDLTWNQAWPTFQPAEYALTGAAGALSIAAYLVIKPPAQARWTGGILFDDAARDAFRLRSPAARDLSRTISDVTVASSIVLAVGVDSLIVPLARGRESVAVQLVLMDAEAFAFSTLLTTTLFDSIGRGRPSYVDCQHNPSFDPLCNSGSTASFPSGHTNLAFTSAGLACAHHANLPLYGGGAADGIACGGEIALATATAALRVMGDRHYVTDVLAGGLIGFGIGFGAPSILHYRVPGEDGRRAVTIAPMGGASQMGFVASGSF
jgi:membrane-associated phospholipid phosphatase